MTDIQTAYCNILNQIHSIRNVVNKTDLHTSLQRKFDRIKDNFETLNIYVHDPISESYDDTRIDCEASIAGENLENLAIVEVIKPIIYFKESDSNLILQKAVVIVEGKK